MVQQEDGAQVAVGEQPGTLVFNLHKWGVEDEDLPGLLHRLNLSQSARCEIKDGRTIQVRMEPAERTFRINPVEDEPSEDPAD
jgi:hypothetical protein